jgi:ubiquinone/menaquinone biosynthesis C-methylase UbiE
MPHETLSDANRARFDSIAASWDEEPRRVDMARAIAQAILETVRPQGTERALEFGAGTGLVTALLAPSLGEVLAVDSSAGMLEVLERKRGELGLGNVRTQQGDLSRETPGGTFDLVFSSMTLHHIRDVQGLLARLAAILVPGGRLALADLDREDGSFHGDAQGVAHHGFERAAVERWMGAAGLEAVEIRTAHVVRKSGAHGEPRDYPVFLATARKPLRGP